MNSKEEAWRKEVRDFVEDEWPIELRGGLYAAPPAYSEDLAELEEVFRRKLADKGWLALALPKEYGGQGRSIIDQMIFAEEMSYYGAPYSNRGAGYVAPTLIRYGSEEQKKEFIGAIARGDVDFCLGYSEPNAGSDLASLNTEAKREGDDFVINGQKVYTTKAEKSSHCFLAARTDPAKPKHKGISLFIVDMNSPGITVRPLWTVGDGRTNEVFFENVRVPARYLVGEEDKGWYYLTTALDLERFIGFPLGEIRYLLDLLIEFAGHASRSGKPLKDESWVKQSLGRISSELLVAKALQFRTVWMAHNGQVPNVEASVLKVMASELLQEVAHTGSRILGLFGVLKEGSHWAPLRGRIERACRGSIYPTFAGGTNEIQRSIIATRGLGLPRS